MTPLHAWFSGLSSWPSWRCGEREKVLLPWGGAEGEERGRKGEGREGKVDITEAMRKRMYCKQGDIPSGSVCTPAMF